MLFRRSLSVVGLLLCSNLAFTQMAHGLIFNDAYSATENLNFSVDGVPINLGTGTVKGTFTAEYAQTGPHCIYFQLSGSGMSANAYGVSIGVPNFTTPWCQFLGVQIECPVYSTGFNINIPDVATVNNTLGFNLEVSAYATPTVSVKWGESASVDVFGDTYNGSTTIEFPVGSFSDFVADNALGAASQASGCQPPTAAEGAAAATTVNAMVANRFDKVHAQEHSHDPSKDQPG